MSWMKTKFAITIAAATLLIAPVGANMSAAHAGNYGHGGGYGASGAAAAGFLGGMLLLNVLPNAQRPHGYGSSPNPDGSRTTSAGVDGGHVVVTHDRNGREIGREFRPRRMTPRHRAANARRAAARANRAVRAAVRAAARQARRAARQARRARNGAYGSAYNPQSNCTTVAWNDANGNRQVQHFNGRLSDRAIRRVVGR